MRRVIDLVAEPRGTLYFQLLHALALQSSTLLMVVRDGLGLNSTGEALLANLQPYFQEKKRGLSWPGTTLIGEEATIYRFTLSREVVDVLVAFTDGLFQWQQPMLPEDLAFLRDDGTAILASICHEEDAYLDVTEEEYQRLSAIPAMKEILRLRNEDQ